jgi:hypothetical protein
VRRQTARQHRRSWHLSLAMAGAIAADPERARRIGRRNIATAVSNRPVDSRKQQWAERWEHLLDLPLENLVAQLLEPGEAGDELRQHAPLDGVLEREVRRSVLEAWRAEERCSQALCDGAGGPLRPDQRFTVDVVRAVSGHLAVAIPSPAEQVVEVAELQEVEPTARTLLGAALGVPASEVRLLVRVDSLHLPGSGAAHAAGRAVLVTKADEDVVLAAAQTLHRAHEPGAADVAGALRDVLQIVLRP